MLRFLRAELAYGAVYLSFASAITLVLWLYEVASGQGVGALIDPAGKDLVFGRPAGDLPIAEFLVVVLISSTIHVLFLTRAREHHQRLLAMLPIPRLQAGLVRLLLVLIPSLAILLFYGGLNWAYTPSGGIEPPFLVVGLGLLLIFYSVAFMEKDLSHFARHSTTVAQIVKLAAVLVAGLGVLSLITWKPSESGVLQTVFEFVRTYNPFGGGYGALKLLLLGLVLGGLSVVSYGRRRSIADPPGPSPRAME